MQDTGRHPGGLSPDMLTYISKRRATEIPEDIGPALCQAARRFAFPGGHMIAGHDRIVAHVMEHGVPPVSLFLGPKSVGKRRLANAHARQHAKEQDILRINRLTVELAREVGNFVRIAPQGRQSLRFAIIDIDTASKTALNILLKSLEEMTSYSFVILLASKPPMETIESRCREVFRFALLTDADVEQALLRRGVSKTEASIRAQASGGQLSTVYDHEKTNLLKKLVLVVVRCFREHDVAALDALASRWTDEHTSLLVQCAHEATTKRWRLFDEAEVEGVSGRTWLAILRALKSDVRPRLVIHAQLAGVLRSIS